MSVSVTMPRLGESVTEGTVTRWLKSEGDHVDADEPLLEVSTDKVDTEVPSPAAGVLTSIKVHEDETVEIGVELAVIGDDGAAPARPNSGLGATGTGATRAGPARAGPARAGQPRAGAAGAGASNGRSRRNLRQRSPSNPRRRPRPEPSADESDRRSSTPPSIRRCRACSGSPRTRSVTPPQPAPHRSQALRPQHLTAPPAAATPGTGAAPGTSPSPCAGAESLGRPAGRRARRTTTTLAGTYVTPLVRKLATEHGVDLTAITGTGVGGRIRKSDVLAAAEQAAQAAAEAAALSRPRPPLAAAATAQRQPPCRPPRRPVSARTRGHVDR